MKKLITWVLMLSTLSIYGLHTEVIFHNERDQDERVSIENREYKTTLAPMQYIKPGGKATFKFENYDPVHVYARVGKDDKESSMSPPYKHYYLRKNGKIDHSKALAPIK